MGAGSVPKTLANCASLGKMLVIENVILAEAMVACAAGTVPKLQLRKVRICAAADSTLVAVAPLGLLFFLLADGGFEPDGLTGILASDTEAKLRQQVCDAVPEKDGVDQPDGQHIQQIPESKLQNVHDCQHYIQHRQPFSLDGKNKLNADHGGWVQGSESQEQDIVEGAGADIRGLVPQETDEGKHHHQGRGAQVKECEFGGPPVFFHRGADGVIEEQTHQNPEGAAALWRDQPGHQPPDLPVQHQLHAKVQHSGSGALGEEVQQIDGGSDKDHIPHQIWDTEAGMGQGKPIHGVVQFSQRESLQYDNHEPLYPLLLEKS